MALFFALSVKKPTLDISPYEDLINSVPDKYKRYWEWFFAFSKIPRQSWNHEFAAPAVEKWLLELGIPKENIAIDEGPNVIARIPATPGFENSPSICIQAHMDVALHNTAEDLPYRVKLENDWFVAYETLLGADDGVGIAWMFLTAEERDTFNHGPIELLFTSDEEVGLVGMNYLRGPDNITHGLRSKYMINIDFFDSDKFAIASAGSIRFEITGKRTITTVKEGWTEITFSIKDMIGGHSGMNMINGRPTPQDWISRCMAELIHHDPPIDFRLSHYLSGDAANVLPVNGEISFAVENDKVNEAIQIISAEYEALKLQYTQVKLQKSTFTIKQKVIEADYKSMSPEDSVKFIDSIFAMHHGIVYFVDKAIYTSQNVAKILFAINDQDEGTVIYQIMPRTHIKGHLDYMRRRVASFARTHNFDSIKELATSDPWNGNETSKLALTFRESYKQITGDEIEPVVFHAGVEAGKFQTRGYTDAEVINFGADTLNAHTIGESVKVSTTNTKTDVFRLFLQKFADPSLKPPPAPEKEEEKSEFNSTALISGVVCFIAGVMLSGLVFMFVYRRARSVAFSSAGTPLL